LLLLLAACAPAPVIVSSGSVLPAEAQRVIDQATATAAAAATSGSVATQAWASTQNALAVHQTEVALSQTQAAGVAMSTDAAARRTQGYANTQAWATGTVEAVRTQAVIEVTDEQRRQANAAGWYEFWSTYRTVLIALIIVSGLSWIAVRFIDRISAIQVARIRELAEIAKSAFRILPPAHWAEYQPGDGYRVYSLPGLLLDEPSSESTAVIENLPIVPDRAFEWRQAVRLFCHWGDRYGFGIDHLGASGAGVVTDPAWRQFSKLLKDAGVLASRPIPGRPGRVTSWAETWDYRRFAHEVSHGPLALPFPTDTEAPKVRVAVPTEQQN